MAMPVWKMCIRDRGEISYVVKGSLAYEDNWPDKNDYDMNDVVIYYSSTCLLYTSRCV